MTATPRDASAIPLAIPMLSAAIGRLVPDSHAAYRSLVADGLLAFIGRLSRPRLEELVAAQWRLPASAGHARRLEALLRASPTLHKLGQVLARDRRIDPKIRRRLQTLESSRPGPDADAAIAALRRETRAVPRLTLGRRALATGSVAIAVPCTWREHPGVPDRRGVLKILRPGVAERLHEELGILKTLGPFLTDRTQHYRLRQYDFQEILDAVASQLEREINLTNEQRNLEIAAKLHATSPAVTVPELWPISTPTMTAMTRINGIRITDFRAPAIERRQLATNLIETLLAAPLISRRSDEVAFHGDPHAGNLLVTTEGKLAVLDWAMVARLGYAEREAIVHCVVGALALDPGRITSALSSLGNFLNQNAAEGVVANAIERVRIGVFPGMRWLADLLDDLAASSAMQLSADVIVLRKALLTLDGVLADVCESTSIDETMVRFVYGDFLRGSIGRPFALRDGRHLGGHLSNADLLRLWSGLPLSFARFWFGRY